MNIKQTDICQELHQNFIDFAYEANSQRAFPDARDGLKPGQRACLWEMFVKGYLPTKPHVKSAKISGGTIASWWPHGDVSIYETFARMSQPWINNIPEVDWHGSNGNIVIGSAPASARYTEARLSKAAVDGLFEDIKKENVNMIDNFSEDDKWPEVLPAILPRLLINGSQGIGVTIANTWLPMNLKEVVEVIKQYLAEGVINYDLPLIDFPSGGTIINRDSISAIHKTGKGKVVLRGKATIDKNHIYITELPYQVYVEPFLEQIKNLVVENEIKGIKEWYNKSDKRKLFIDIVVSNSELSENILNILYDKTDLQKNYNANQWALVSKTPKLLSLKEYLDIYIEHNINCLIKANNFEKEKAERKAEIDAGLLKALVSINEIIELIKKSESSKVAKEALIKTYGFTDSQAIAIVNMKLGRLAGLERVEIQNEYDQLIEKINHLNSLVSNRKNLNDLLIKKLENLAKKYGNDRKTVVENIEIKKVKKETPVIEKEDVVVCLLKNGNVKRVAPSSFKIQRARGKGSKTPQNNIVESIAATTLDTLMLFSKHGKYYELPIHKIPDSGQNSQGIPIASLVNLDATDSILSMTIFNKEQQDKDVIFFTKNGKVKKTSLQEYAEIKKKSGVQAIKLVDNDLIAAIDLVKDEDLIVVSKKGYIIRFNAIDFSSTGRVTSGVKSINLGEDDEIIGGFVIKNNNNYLSVFANNGTAKQMPISEFPYQKRGGKGNTCLKAKEENIYLVAAYTNDQNTNFFLVGTPNSIGVSAQDISIVSRTSSFGIVIKNSIITNVLKI